MNIPLFDDDKIVLVAGVGNKESPYEESDVQQLSLLMDGMWKIIKHKRMDEALRDSEEKYHSAMDNAGDMILLMDLDGNILEANKKAEEVLGYTKEELAAKHYSTIHPSDEFDRTSAAFSEIILKGRTYFKDGIIVRKDGTTVPVDITGSLITYAGKLLVQGIFSNITERKRKEDEIRFALSLQKSTIESTADGILVVDRQGRIVSFNQKFREMWHIPQNVMDTRNDNEALSYVLEQLTDPGSFLSKVQELYAHPHETSFDIIEFKDGRFFERYSQPQEIEGRILGRVWSFRDVTDRNKALEALKKKEAELKKRVKELEEFYHLAVGRELRMIELKKEIAKLKVESEKKTHKA
jgi:PAS domain S-box-containing protein